MRKISRISSGEDDLLTKLGDTPGFLNRLDHLRSPRPFRLLLRLPPWQTAEKAAACTVTFLVSLPLPRTLTPYSALAQDALRQQSFSSDSHRRPRTCSRALRLMISRGLAKMLLKPRLGMRRARGIWPPSKPTRMPAAGTGLLALVAAAGGLAVAGAVHRGPYDRLPGWSRRRETVRSVSFSRASLFYFGDLQQIADLGDLAAGLVRCRAGWCCRRSCAGPGNGRWRCAFPGGRSGS